MLYAWIGFLKPDAEPISQSVQQLTTSFLAQPFIKILSAGPLRAPPGKRAGMMMIFERESREAAENFIAESPYLRAELYEESGLYEYLNEVG